MIEVGLGTVKGKNINFFLSRYQISIEVFIVGYANLMSKDSGFGYVLAA
jgi:hypothetical protein